MKNVYNVNRYFRLLSPIHVCRLRNAVYKFLQVVCQHNGNVQRHRWTLWNVANIRKPIIKTEADVGQPYLFKRTAICIFDDCLLNLKLVTWKYLVSWRRYQFLRWLQLCLSYMTNTEIMLHYHYQTFSYCWTTLSASLTSVFFSYKQ